MELEERLDQLVKAMRCGSGSVKRSMNCADCIYNENCATKSEMLADAADFLEALKKTFFKTNEEK